MQKLLAALIVTAGLMVLPVTAMACDGGGCPAKPEPKEDTAAKPVEPKGVQLACDNGNCPAKPEPIDETKNELACNQGCPAKPDPVTDGDGKTFKTMKAKP